MPHGGELQEQIWNGRRLRGPNDADPLTSVIILQPELPLATKGNFALCAASRDPPPIQGPASDLDGGGLALFMSECRQPLDTATDAAAELQHRMINQVESRPHTAFPD